MQYINKSDIIQYVIIYHHIMQYIQNLTDYTVIYYAIIQYNTI